jgi:serine/threonine protein kinase
MVHHDVKADNVVRHRDGRLALIDYGCCSEVQYRNGHPVHLSQFAGTPLWSSIRHVAFALERSTHTRTHTHIHISLERIATAADGARLSWMLAME